MRKPLTPQEKWEILLEALGNASGPDAVCMRRGITLTELRQWLMLARSGALERLTHGPDPAHDGPPHGIVTAQLKAKEAAPPPPPPVERPAEPSPVGLTPAQPLNLDALFSLVTHELKEPIRGIRALCQFVEEDFAAQLPDRARTYLTMMTESANRLQLLVDGLGEYARVLRGLTPTAQVPMTEVAEHVRMSLSSLIKSRNALVVVDSLLPVVRGDQAGLQLCLRHLVQNGILFNKSETPRVEVVVSAELRVGWIGVDVRDNGIGVEERHWQKMFDLFQRLNRYEDYPGAGAGLAIASKILQAHGGRLEIHSKSGEGSTFRIWLPR